jgi:hypothetical protein
MTRHHSILAAVLGAALLAPVAAPAASTHAHAGIHGGHHPAVSGEVGQGAFAAIAEIVARLEAEPSTDWSKVDISALRRHLVDMSALTLGAEVASTPVPGGLDMHVTGQGRTLGAIRRMVPAHAVELSAVPGWRVEAQAMPDGARLVVVGGDGDQAKIRGLGFFGLMALGTHHQSHHWAMATGRAVHAH